MNLYSSLVPSGILIVRSATILKNKFSACLYFYIKLAFYVMQDVLGWWIWMNFTEGRSVWNYRIWHFLVDISSSDLRILNLTNCWKHKDCTWFAVIWLVSSLYSLQAILQIRFSQIQSYIWPSLPCKYNILTLSTQFSQYLSI
jgi:hypothetical protein